MIIECILYMYNNKDKYLQFKRKSEISYIKIRITNVFIPIYGAAMIKNDTIIQVI